MFTPFQLGSLQLVNRIVALPVFTGYAMPDGRISGLLIDHYARLARSGAGLVMVANVSVRPDGITSRHCLRLDGDRFIHGMTQLAEAIHRGGARAGLQLNHAGRLALSNRPLLPASLSGANLAFNVASLKDFMNFFPVEARFGLTRRLLRMASTWQQAMRPEECRDVIEDFTSAALRAARAGFDVVELHGASGYLISQFLSAFTNPPVGDDEADDRRRRFEFPLALFARVRRALDPQVPLGWRLMLREFAPGGIDPDQALALGRGLARAGAAYVSVSAGTFNSLFAGPVMRFTHRPGHLGADCAALRRDLNIPVVAAGRIVTPAVARRLLKDGQADLVGLARPLRADPGWVRKAARGRPVNVCFDCNWCLRRVVLDQGLGCVRWPRLRLARVDLAHRKLSRLYRWLWIVADPSDMARYQTMAPLLRLAADDDPAAAPATVLFLRKGSDPRREAVFLDWVRETFSPRAQCAPVRLQLALAAGRRSEALIDLVRREGYGGVVLCRSPQEPWRRRLVYRPRGKVAVLLGRGGNARQLLVPVDFSEASLLQLALVRRMMADRSDLRVDLVCVARESDREMQDRWASLRRISRWPEQVPLNVIPPAGDVAGTLVRRAREAGCGTVVMGKRGLSGVKRLLLGSVSAAVMAGLADATVVLVD